MKFARIVTTVAMAASVVGLAAPAAQAKTTPTINLHVPAQATAGQPFNYTYSRANIPAGDKVLIQRQIGTKGWKTVGKATAKSGKGSVPGLQLGKYWVRIALFDKHGKGIKSVKRLVKVYGVVALAGLCNNPDLFLYSTTPCGQIGADAVSGTLFNYTVGVGIDDTSSHIELKSTTTTCRHLHLIVAMPDYNMGNDDSTGTSVTVSLQQTKSDPISVTTGIGAISVLDSHLDGGSYQVTDVLNQDHYGSFGIDYNGWLECYSASGT